jgi:hypothetical protein
MIKKLGAEVYSANHGHPARKKIKYTFFSGMKIVDDVPKILYNQNNSGLGNHSISDLLF